MTTNDSSRDTTQLEIVDLSFRQALEELTQVLPEYRGPEIDRWSERLNQCWEALRGETYFVFSGEYSTGKSTFVNALLRANVLPTADDPCTSVVTEVVIVSTGEGHRSTVHYLDGREEEIAPDNLRRLLDGRTGEVGRFASIHHVTMEYDVGLADSEGSTQSLLALLANGKVRLVDTPGYNSPFGFNQEVVKYYVGRAAYAFWFFPCDKFGGFRSRDFLNQFKRSGRRIGITPLFTKSDLITEAERPRLEAEFLRAYGDLFGNDPPRFVSPYKLTQAIQSQKTCEEALTKEEREDAGRQKLKLEQESGIEAFATELLTRASDRQIGKTKIDKFAKEFQAVGHEILKALVESEKEVGETLKQSGWSENDRFERLSQRRRLLESWAEKECGKIATAYEAGIVERIVPLLGSLGKAGQPKTIDRIKRSCREVNDSLEANELHEAKEYILRTFKVEAEFDLKPLRELELQLDDAIKRLSRDKLLSLLDAFSHAGLMASVSGGVGGALLVAAGPLAQVALIGGALSGAAVFVGAAFILYAFIPLIPALVDADERRRKEAESSVRAHVRTWLQTSKFDKVILKGLRDAIRLTHDAAIVLTQSSQGRLLAQLEGVRSSRAQLKEALERLRIAAL